jgi:hypothetical protein
VTVCAWCFLVPAAQQRPPDYSRLSGYVVSSDTAYVMMSAQPVAGDRIMNLSWAPTGMFLLATRSDTGSPSSFRGAVLGQNPPEAPETSVILYNLETKKSASIWKGRADVFGLESIAWLSGTNEAVIVSREKLRTEDPENPMPSRQTVWLLDANHGSMSAIMTQDQRSGSPTCGVLASPAKPFALICLLNGGMQAEVVGPNATSRPNAMQFSYRYLSRDGSLGKLIDMGPVGLTGSWSADGTMPLVVKRERDNGKVKITAFKMQPETAQLEPDPTKQAWKPVDMPVKAEITAGKIVLDGKDKLIRSAWLVGSSNSSRAIIANDASAALVSPTQNAVAYISDGVALIRPIVKIPGKAFLEALAAAERSRLMSNAKQVALAAIMYGSDYDDVLPGSGSNIGDILNPYARNSDIFDGLNYTFKGGSMSDIKDPAHTSLGYVQGSGGRAVIYADGHVEWVPG